jgi:hypothetical protein
MNWNDLISDYGNVQKFGTVAGLGGIASGLFGGNNNPADAGMDYLKQIPGTISPYYQPYMNAGNEALPRLQNQYSNLLNDPGGMLNKIGAGYQQSPGFKFALQQALQGAQHQAAAGGMAGSPQAQQQGMELATQIGNQDYYNWLGKAEGLYGAGLQGMGGISNMGFNASQSLAEQIAQALAAQSQLGYAGKAAENQAQGSSFGNILGGAATLAAFL